MSAGQMHSLQTFVSKVLKQAHEQKDVEMAKIRAHLSKRLRAAQDGEMVVKSLQQANEDAMAVVKQYVRSQNPSKPFSSYSRANIRYPFLLGLQGAERPPGAHAEARRSRPGHREQTKGAQGQDALGSQRHEAGNRRAQEQPRVLQGCRRPSLRARRIIITNKIIQVSALFRRRKTI